MKYFLKFTLLAVLVSAGLPVLADPPEEINKLADQAAPSACNDILIAKFSERLFSEDSPFIKDDGKFDYEAKRHDFMFLPKKEQLERAGVDYIKVIDKATNMPAMVIVPSKTTQTNEIAKYMDDHLNTLTVIDPIYVTRLNLSAVFTPIQSEEWVGMLRLHFAYPVQALIHEGQHAHLTGYEQNGTGYLRGAYYKKGLGRGNIGNYSEFFSFQEFSTFSLQLAFIPTSPKKYLASLREISDSVLGLADLELTQDFSSLETEVVNGVECYLVQFSGDVTYMIPKKELDGITRHSDVRKDYVQRKMAAQIDEAKAVKVVLNQLETLLAEGRPSEEEIKKLGAQLLKIERDHDYAFYARSLDHHSWVFHLWARYFQ